MIKWSVCFIGFGLVKALGDFYQNWVAGRKEWTDGWIDGWKEGREVNQYFRRHASSRRLLTREMYKKQSITTLLDLGIRHLGLGVRGPISELWLSSSLSWGLQLYLSVPQCPPLSNKWEHILPYWPVIRIKFNPIRKASGSQERIQKHQPSSLPWLSPLMFPIVSTWYKISRCLLWGINS